MNRLHLSKSILTAILVVGTIASFWLDWRENHLLSPQWHPHAKFHGGLLLFTLAGTSATGLWVLWRKSAEPAVAVRIVALLALAYWTPLLYVNALVPGSSLWAGEPGHEPRWHGHVYYPNVIFAGVFAGLIVVAGFFINARTPSASRV